MAIRRIIKIKLRGGAVFRADRVGVLPPAIPGVRHVALRRGGFAIVNDDDFALVLEHPWTVDSDGYAITAIRVGYRQRMIKMHRLLASPNADEEVDHKNRNRLDNRQSNLRRCSREQNRRNDVRKSISGYRGVFKKGNRWHAVIKQHGVATQLGSFVDPVMAAKAYDRTALARFGEFAQINFMCSGDR